MHYDLGLVLYREITHTRVILNSILNHWIVPDPIISCHLTWIYKRQFFVQIGEFLLPQMSTFLPVIRVCGNCCVWNLKDRVTASCEWNLKATHSRKLNTGRRERERNEAIGN